MTRRKAIRRGKASVAAGFDAAAWAKGRSFAPGRTCGTCAQPEVAQAIRDVLGVIVRGEGRPSLAAIHAMLRERFGYARSLAAMQLHVREHETALWSKIRGEA